MKQRVGIVLIIASLPLGCSSLHHAGGPPNSRADYCAEYRQTMAGKSIEQRRQAAEEHIVRMHGSADAAHIERHIRMMEQRCGNAPAAGREG